MEIRRVVCRVGSVGRRVRRSGGSSVVVAGVVCSDVDDGSVSVAISG